MKLHHVAATLVLSGCAFTAGAQSMKPGLWEIANKMGGNPELEKSMAEMQKQMASMPPEQRKMMQEMMAKQGVSMDAGAGGAMVMKMCMTKEMVERNQLPTQQQGDCKTTVTSRSANTMKMSFTCAQPPSSGEGEYTFSGDTAYTMKMTMNTTHQGKPMRTTMDAKGKWLGADCGTIKPMQIPAK